MAKTGVFPVSASDWEIDIKYGTGTAEFVKIADMESASISIDSGVENWTPLEAGGWQRSMLTAKALTLNMSGKRNFGDQGNDFVANTLNKLGQDAMTRAKCTFPNGDTFEFNAVISLGDFVGADSTNVSPLSFDLVSDGEPVYTVATE